MQNRWSWLLKQLESWIKSSKVFELLSPSSKYKYAPIKILKEEVKEEISPCKTKLRRKSTTKAKIVNEDERPIVQERRRSKRIICGLKRNSRDLNQSAFKPLEKKKKDSKEEILLNSNVFNEERKDEILTDNECYSLKIPSLKDFNLSNTWNECTSKLWIDDRLSDFSGSNKLSNSKFPVQFIENLTDQDKVDAEEINDKTVNSLK